MATISDNIPLQNFDVSSIEFPLDYQMANPDLYKSRGIDLLLVAGVFWNLLCPVSINISKTNLTLQHTHLCCVMSGNLSLFSNKSLCNLSIYNDVQDQLKKFCAIEEIPKSTVLLPEQEACKALSISNTSRNKDEKCVVTILLKHPSYIFENSKQEALKRFKSLELSSSQNHHFKELYINFMDEFEVLDHML